MDHLRRGNKILGPKLAKTPRGGVFIFASLAWKNWKKNPPLGGFSRETPILNLLVQTSLNQNPGVFPKTTLQVLKLQHLGGVFYR